VIRAIIEAARRHGKPVIVDPKGHDYRVYRGAGRDLHLCRPGRR
jgi:D-beta-D-heptose 7-phosphate kinase/D-beta-D-heptose 1-phosphate adenosyltransferase